MTKVNKTEEAKEEEEEGGGGGGGGGESMMADPYIWHKIAAVTGKPPF